MSQLLEFSVLVIVISASGVMAPGPLFAANIAHGLRGGTKSGIKMAIGHTIVELPLVILLGIGVFSLELNYFQNLEQSYLFLVQLHFLCLQQCKLKQFLEIKCPQQI